MITIDVSGMSTMQRHLLKCAIVETLEKSARELHSDIASWYTDKDSDVYRDLLSWRKVASETARDVEKQFNAIREG